LGLPDSGEGCKAMNSAQLLPYRCECRVCGKTTNHTAIAGRPDLDPRPVKLVLCQGCGYATVAREIFNPGGAK
jgi:hypothetical protein